jgi:hypothetical protein
MRTPLVLLALVSLFVVACQEEYTETPVLVHIRTVPGLKPADYNLQTGQDLAFALRNMYHWYQGGTSFTCSESVYRGIDLKYQLLLDDMNQTPAGFSVQVDITHLGVTIHSQTHALVDTTVSWWGDTQGVSSGSFRVR